MSDLLKLRKSFHDRLCNNVFAIETRSDGLKYPNFADPTKTASVKIAWHIVDLLGHSLQDGTARAKSTSKRFVEITRDFLQESCDLLQHLSPGAWRLSTGVPISEFDQYEHLAVLERLVENSDELASALGKEYIITPDIVVARYPVTDQEINTTASLLASEDPVATYTPLRKANNPKAICLLHASISCKWTLRSDRGQNARTEALNLVRHRKGHLPHVVAVTAEPLPTRIASLALGTGDLDCVYHFALPELKNALIESENEDQMDMLETLISGRRLRDISDLPFDLAI